MLIRRSVLEEGNHRFDPEMRVHEDSDFFIRLMMKGWRFDWVREIVSIYRAHDTHQNATDEEKQDVTDFVTAKVRESYYNGINAGRKPAGSHGKPEGTSAGKTS